MELFQKLNAGNKSAVPKTHIKAVEANSRFYFTGKKCKKGHVSVRETTGRRCCVCEHEKEMAPSSPTINKNMIIECFGILFDLRGLNGDSRSTKKARLCR